MPVIPPAQEQQRLSPSSPVSIGSSEEARLMGDTVAKVGEAAFDLGVLISKNASERERAIAKLEAENAANELERRYNLEKFNRINDTTVNHPKDLLFAVEESVKPFDDELNSSLTSDMARSFYTNLKTKLYADKSLTTLGDGDGIAKKRMESLVTQRMSKHAEDMADLFVTPGVGRNKRDQELSIRLLQIDAEVDTLDNIPESMKEVKKAEFKASVVKSVVDRLNAGANFLEAEHVLDRYGGAGIFSAEAVAKERDNISTKQYYHIGKLRETYTTTKLMGEESVRQKQVESFNTLKDMMISAKTPIERDKVNDYIDRSDLLPAQRSELRNIQKENTKTQDDPLVTSFMNKILNEGSSAKILKELEVMKNLKNSPLSYDGYKELLKFYNVIRKETNIDRRTEIKYWMDKAEAAKGKTASDLGGEKYKREHDMRVDGEQLNFMMALNRNKNESVESIAKRTIVRALPEMAREYKGGKTTVETLAAGQDKDIREKTNNLVKAQLSGNQDAIRRATKELNEAKQRKGLK